MNAKLIDISKWQDDDSTPQRFDFSKAVAQGVVGVGIKASERMGVDADFIWNWESAKKAGLYRMAYHFLRWDIAGATQANFFCDLLKDDPGELPPVADFEAPAKTMSNGTIKYPSNALLFDFLTTVQNRMGVVPMIYTSPGFWNSHGKVKGASYYDEKWAYFPLWIAHYNVDTPTVPKPWKNWAFWQYTVSPEGKKYGAESEGIDLDVYNGTLEEMIEQFNLEQHNEDPGTEVPPLENPVDFENRLKKLENWAKSFQ